MMSRCRNRMALNPTKSKTHIDGDETKTPEKTAPFKSKVRDHANRASFKTSPTWSNCRRTAKVAWDGCAGVHMKQLYSLHKRAVKFLMPIPNLDYKQKCCALKLLPLDKQLLLSKCVLMQKVVHGKAPQYLKDLMIPFERLHVHGNKQLLPRTRIDIFKTSFSFQSP